LLHVRGLRGRLVEGPARGSRRAAAPGRRHRRGLSARHPADRARGSARGLSRRHGNDARVAVDSPDVVPLQESGLGPRAGALLAGLRAVRGLSRDQHDAARLAAAAELIGGRSARDSENYLAGAVVRPGLLTFGGRAPGGHKKAGAGEPRAGDMGRVDSPRRRASDAEDAPGDVANAAVHLHRIVLAVEVVDAADLARLDLPCIGIAEIPAAAVVAHDQLVAPGLAFVLADGSANAVAR